VVNSTVTTLRETGAVPDIWDVAIVGAGPAGTAAALGALQRRPDARVLLIDRADFPRDKPCGDGIAPQALDVLAGLGVDVGALVAGYAPVAALALRSPSGAEVARTMARPAYVVPRAVLDARLLDTALARGAVLRRRVVRRVECLSDRVVVDGTVSARVVIGADGAESVVRRCLGVARNGPGHLAVAIRGYASAPTGPSEQRIVMTGRNWPAYAWSFPIGDGRANVGYGEVLRGRALSRRTLLDGLERLLPGATATGRGWRAHHLPLSTRRPHQPDGRVLLAGDAASLINPFTGEGIYYAVLSGAESGVAALAGADAGAVYRAGLRRSLGRHLRHTTVAARLVGRPALVDAGVRAARADQRVFDGLVELGLGSGPFTPRLLGATAAAALPRASR
jgi:geranylgeranyl reductase family protein